MEVEAFLAQVAWEVEAFLVQEDLATGEPAIDMTWQKKKDSFDMTAFRVSTSCARTDLVFVLQIS